MGNVSIGQAIQKAGTFASANLPFMLQDVGGEIARAMTIHMQSVFKTPSFYFHSDTET